MKYILVLILLTSCASSVEVQEIDASEGTQVEFTEQGIVITNR